MIRPKEFGTFTFTVRASFSHSDFAASTATFTLTVKDNTNVNVNDAIDTGYGIKTYLGTLVGTDYLIDGDYVITDFSELEFTSFGPINEFKGLWLNGEKLSDIEFIVEDGSTRTVGFGQAAENKVDKDGTNTIAIEFREDGDDGKELKRTPQNFKVDIKDTKDPTDGTDSTDPTNPTTSSNPVNPWKPSNPNNNNQNNYNNNQITTDNAQTITTEPAGGDSGDSNADNSNDNSGSNQNENGDDSNIQPTGDSGGSNIGSGNDSVNENDDPDSIYFKGNKIPLGGTILAGMNEPLIIRINTPFNRFLGLLADGKELIRDVEYDAKEGSTILTVYTETLAKLGEGEHIFTALFADGKEIDILVNLSVEVDKDNPQTGVNNPGTGAGIMSLLLLIIALTSSAIIIVKFKRKRQIIQ